MTLTLKKKFLRIKCEQKQKSNFCVSSPASLLIIWVALAPKGHNKLNNVPSIQLPSLQSCSHILSITSSTSRWSAEVKWFPVHVKGPRERYEELFLIFSLFSSSPPSLLPTFFSPTRSLSHTVCWLSKQHICTNIFHQEIISCKVPY